jgi:catechol-2,3-dioxygenase
MEVAALAERPSALDLAGISHLVVEVGDLDKAADFYSRILGLKLVGRDVLPNCGAHVALKSPSGQWVALVSNPDRLDLREMGVHQAYRVSVGAKAAISARLLAEGIEIKTYKEDRTAEDGDNFYFFDPAGNRLQLVVAKSAMATEGVSGIDHAAVQVADMMWAEEFYTNEFRLAVDHRVGWKTADYARARKWAAGEEDMAPGTRRLDERYTVMVNRKKVPRANMQIFVRVGSGSVLGVYLAHKHFQESPEEQIVGSPRTAFAVANRAALDSAAKLLASHGRKYVGPMVHAAASPIEESLYFKDTGGNFFELCVPRKGMS